MANTLFNDGHASNPLFQLYLTEISPRGGGGYLDLFFDGDVPFFPKNWYP